MKIKNLFYSCLICLVTSSGHAQAVSSMTRASMLRSNDWFSVSTNGTATRKVSYSQIRNGVRPAYNVLDYGADPTGVASSQPAIQAAIDAACVDPTKPVYIPAGTYKMGLFTPKPNYLAEGHPSCLTIWSNNVTILGDGPEVTRLVPGTDAFSEQRNFMGIPGTLGDGVTLKSTTNFTMIGVCLDMEGRSGSAGLYDTTQFYRVFGDQGIVLRNCWFLNNGGNDGIDTQFGFDLTVEDCVVMGNAGDAIGVQNRSTRVSNTLLKNNGQEALELNDAIVVLHNVHVENCQAMGTIGAYQFSATGCTFISTNGTKPAFDVSEFMSTRHVLFENCVFEEKANSVHPTFLVRPNDSLEVSGCDVRSSGGVRPFIIATNADVVRVSNSTFGRSVWDNSFPGAGVIATGCRDVIVQGNVFMSPSPSVVASNGVLRLKISDNSFRGDVILTSITNATVGNNTFTNSALRATNLFSSIVSANLQAELLHGTLAANVFSGNVWRTTPQGSYTTNAISGDLVDGRPFYGGRLDSRPYFTTGLEVASGSATQPSLLVGPAGAGLAADTTILRLLAGGSTVASVGPGLISEYSSCNLRFSNLELGNGTASAPAINFNAWGSGDSDSGFYREAGDHLGWVSGGNLRALTTTTNLLIPNAKVDQLLLPTNTAPADTVTIRRWFRVLASDGQFYMLGGRQ